MLRSTLSFHSLTSQFDRAVHQMCSWDDGGRGGGDSDYLGAVDVADIGGDLQDSAALKFSHLRAIWLNSSSVELS